MPPSQPHPVAVPAIGRFQRLQDAFVSGTGVVGSQGTPQQPAGPDRPAAVAGDRLHIVGIVLVEPPQEQDAVGVHVGDDDVETPFRLLDERVVVQDIAQADQAVEPVSAAFIRPCPLGQLRRSPVIL